MADDNYILITARLDEVRSTAEIQKQLDKISNNIILRIHNVELTQNFINNLNSAIKDVEKNIRININDVSIDQSKTIQQAQNISKQISSAMNQGVGSSNAGSNINRAFDISDKVANQLKKRYTDVAVLAETLQDKFKKVGTVTTEVLSHENQIIDQFRVTVTNADGAVEKLVYSLKQVDGTKKHAWEVVGATSSDNNIKLQEQLEKQTIKASDASLRLSNNLESVKQKFAEIVQVHDGDANIANYLDNAVKAINALNGADSSNFNKLKINAENAIQEYTNYLNKLKTTDAQNIRLQEQLEKQIAKSSNASLKLSNNLEGAKKKLSEVLQNHGNDANITRYLENAVQAINTLNKADGSNFDRLKINAENAIQIYTDYLNKLKTADTQAEQSQRRLDAQLVSSQKTLDHNIMILGNLSKNSIFGKNATSPEVVEMQANVDKLRESYQNLKTNTTDSIASPELIGKFKDLNVQIVDTIVNSQKLAKTLSDKTTNVVPEVELNNLKTLMNNLKASDVEVDKLKADYGELVGLMIQAQDTGDWSNYLRQLDIFKSKFSEAKSEVKATTAATSELKKMAKSLTSNKMNTFFDKNSNNAQVNALKTEINSLINEWTTLNSEIQTTGKISPAMATRLEELKAKMQNATTAADTLQKNIKEVANAQRLATQKQSLDTRISSWFQNNTRASAETIASLKNLQAQIHDADAQTMFNLNDQFKQITAHARAAGEAGLKLSDIIKQKLGKFAGWFSIATVVMSGVNKLKEMYREVVELDTAMVGLRKVTDETDAVYNKFFTDAAKNAKILGTSIKDIIDSTTEFARLGYSLADSQLLAQMATLYKNVGDGIDIGQATSNLISTMKAFGLSANEVESIIDKFNKVKTCPFYALVKRDRRQIFSNCWEFLKLFCLLYRRRKPETSEQIAYGEIKAFWKCEHSKRPKCGLMDSQQPSYICYRRYTDYKGIAA